jgi:hypothetical protein
MFESRSGGSKDPGGEEWRVGWVVVVEAAAEEVVLQCYFAAHD